MGWEGGETRRKVGVSLSLINLSHLVFNPCVDFTQLNAWYIPSVGCLGKTHTHTHTRVETGCWCPGMKGRGHNVLMKEALGSTWLSAGVKPAKHQGTIITPPTHTHTHIML